MHLRKFGKKNKKNRFFNHWMRKVLKQVTAQTRAATSKKNKLNEAYCGENEFAICLFYLRGVTKYIRLYRWVKREPISKISTTKVPVKLKLHLYQAIFIALSYKMSKA